MPGPYDYQLDPALAADAYQALQQRQDPQALALQALQTQYAPPPAAPSAPPVPAPRPPPGLPPAPAPLYDPQLAQQLSPDAPPDAPPAPAPSTTPSAPAAPVQGVFAAPPGSGPPKSRSVLDELQLSAPRLGASRAPASPFGQMLAETAPRRAEEERAAAQAEARGDYATAAAQQGIADTAAAQAGAHEALADEHSQLALQGAAYQEKLARVQQREDALFAKTQTRLNEIETQMRKTASERPENQSIGSRVAGAIAVALAGIADTGARSAALIAGQGMPNTGQADAVARMINQGIERDIEGQKRRYAQHRDAFAATKEDLAVGLQQTGNAQDAEKAAWLSQLEQSQNKLKAIAARGASAETKALADETIAKLDLQRAQVLQDLHGSLAQRYREQEQGLRVAQYQDARQRAAAQSGGIAGQLALLGKAADIDKTRAETAKLQGESGPSAGQVVPGGRRVADPSIYGRVEKSTLADYVKGEHASQSLIGAAQELGDLVKQYGTENLPTEAKARMETLAWQVKLGIKNASELGTLDKGSAQVMDEMVGDPTAWNGGFGAWANHIGAKIGQITEGVRRDSELRAKNLGLEYDPTALRSGRGLTQRGAR